MFCEEILKIRSEFHTWLVLCLTGRNCNEFLPATFIVNSAMPNLMEIQPAVLVEKRADRQARPLCISYELCILCK